MKSPRATRGQSNGKQGLHLQKEVLDKTARVKVGIRCRPAFEDEVESNDGEDFEPIVALTDRSSRINNGSSSSSSSSSADKADTLSLVSLTLISGKRRDFHFDYAFDASCGQDVVYDRVANPVVSDVLRGFNGTIFAYGQTGTGKTYTMGILETVYDERAGIIPRAISQIFDHVAAQETAEIHVTLSFLQIYRESIQDLLATASGELRGPDENLVIREDPHRGFYVEGLQEYSVRNYGEAEALLNLGLESRAIASTLMNVTSSRSHTILTLNLQQHFERSDDAGEGRPPRAPNTPGGRGYSRTVKSKLLMVDLAGSERVRRTISKGTRLSEAKSINTSLSALGNVIAALADPSQGHIPYRDSKLTRLLQDSLGGTASTALVATIGPAAINYGETLSTLLFAARCMAVKVTPVQHEEVDYAEMCARLQARVASMEGVMVEKLQEQQRKYEAHISSLKKAIPGGGFSNVHGDEDGSLQRGPSALNASELERVLLHINSDSSGHGGDWLTIIGEDSRVMSVLAYSYQLLHACYLETTSILKGEELRSEELAAELVQRLTDEANEGALQEEEEQLMQTNDPLVNTAVFSSIGNHLSRLPRLEAISKVERDVHSDGEVQCVEVDLPASITAFSTADDLATALATLHGAVEQNMRSIALLLGRKDARMHSVKMQLADQMVERRKREEEVVNWSYILKHLLEKQSALRADLRLAQKQTAATAYGGGARFTGRSPPESHQRPHEQKRGQGYEQQEQEREQQEQRGSARPSEEDSARASRIQEDITRRVDTVRQTLLSPRPGLVGAGTAASASTPSKSFRASSPVMTARAPTPAVAPAATPVAHTHTPAPVVASRSSLPTPAPAASTFAKNIVQDLGVGSGDAPAAMNVIDRVSSMTPSQLSMLDAGTQKQVMHIREKLGLPPLTTPQPAPIPDDDEYSQLDGI